MGKGKKEKEQKMENIGMGEKVRDKKNERKEI